MLHTPPNQEHGLFIPHRQLSIMISLLLISGATVFVAGYYFGKHDTILQLTNPVQLQVPELVSTQPTPAQDLLTDLIEESQRQQELTSVEKSVVQNTAKVENPTPTPVSALSVKSEQPAVIAASAPIQKTESSKEKESKVSPAIIAPNPTVARGWQGQLAGFGTRKAAQRLAQRLQECGFNAEVKQRVSVSAQKKKVIWYQVVTPIYPDREQVTNVVDRIARQEKLKDVRIVTA